MALPGRCSTYGWLVEPRFVSLLHKYASGSCPQTLNRFRISGFQGDFGINKQMPVTQQTDSFQQTPYSICGFGSPWISTVRFLLSHKCLQTSLCKGRQTHAKTWPEGKLNEVRRKLKLKLNNTSHSKSGQACKMTVAQQERQSIIYKLKARVLCCNRPLLVANNV